ncbi:MAG: hypothetical protein ACYSR9_14420 [Planctomycetota bacterium]|jgi:hypothetical protein
MKKLFYELLLLLLLAFISSTYATTTVTVIGGSTSVCTKGAAVMTDVVDDAGGILTVNDAIGQSISYASGWQLHSIDLHMAGLSENCVMSLKIGPDTTLGDDAYETWTSQNAGSGEKTFTVTSVDNDSFSASTTYYVGIMETSGDCRIRYDTGNEYAGGQYYGSDSSWTLGAAVGARDWDIQVYKCN